MRRNIFCVKQEGSFGVIKCENIHEIIFTLVSVHFGRAFYHIQFSSPAQFTAAFYELAEEM